MYKFYFSQFKHLICKYLNSLIIFPALQAKSSFAYQQEVAHPSNRMQHKLALPVALKRSTTAEAGKYAARQHQTMPLHPSTHSKSKKLSSAK